MTITPQEFVAMQNRMDILATRIDGVLREMPSIKMQTTTVLRDQTRDSLTGIAAEFEDIKERLENALEKLYAFRNSL